MSKLGGRVLEEALSLSPDERAELADRLLKSLDPESQREIEACWASEAESRLEAHERGELGSIPAKEAFGAARRSRR